MSRSLDCRQFMLKNTYFHSNSIEFMTFKFLNMFSRTEELLNGIVKIAEDDVLQEKVKLKPKPTPGPPRVQHRRKIPLHSSKSSPHLFSNNSQNSNNNSNKTISSKPTSPATNRRFTCKYLQCRCQSIFLWLVVTSFGLLVTNMNGWIRWWSGLFQCSYRWVFYGARSAIVTREFTGRSNCI